MMKVLIQIFKLHSTVALPTQIFFISFLYMYECLLWYQVEGVRLQKVNCFTITDYERETNFTVRLASLLLFSLVVYVERNQIAWAISPTIVALVQMDMKVAWMRVCVSHQISSLVGITKSGSSTRRPLVDVA
jgi:hypothetical protein